MDDLISRREAIEALKTVAGVGNRALDKLRQLPSAHPTHPNTPNTLNTLDCIGRQEAVEAMYALVDGCVCDDEYRENPHIDAIVDTLENLPSAQKTGKWMPFDVPWYQCSECGAVRKQESFMENFCQNCGAKMGVEG